MTGRLNVRAGEKGTRPKKVYLSAFSHTVPCNIRIDSLFILV